MASSCTFLLTEQTDSKPFLCPRGWLSKMIVFSAYGAPGLGEQTGNTVASKSVSDFIGGVEERLVTDHEVSVKPLDLYP